MVRSRLTHLLLCFLKAKRAPRLFVADGVCTVEWQAFDPGRIQVDDTIIRPTIEPLPTSWNSDFIANLAEMLRPEVYVELGVRRAATFNIVAPYAGQAIGVDMDPGVEAYVQSAANVQLFLGTTDEYLAEIERTGLLIDMLFIDADHARSSVLQDFRGFLPHVRPQGIILLHDGHPGDESLLAPESCADAYLAVEELSRDAREYEMVTIPLSPGLTICRKRTRQLSWQEPAHDGVRPSVWRMAHEGADSRTPVLRSTASEVAPELEAAERRLFLSERKNRLYERSLGLAVIPVLVRRTLLRLFGPPRTAGQD